MARLANPYYSNPQIGAIVENVGRALMGDPEADANARLRDAQTNAAQQQAAKLMAERSTITNRNFGTRTAFNGLGSGGSVADAVLGLGASGGDTDSLEFLRAFMAAQGGEGNARVGNLIAGGGALGPDQSFTVSGQDRIRGDNERIEDERLATEQGGLMARLLATPLTESQVAGQILQGQDPAFQRARVAPTRSQREGEVIASVPPGATPSDALLSLLDPGAALRVNNPSPSDFDPGIRVPEAIDMEISARLGSSKKDPGVPIDLGLRSAIRVRAEQIMRDPVNPLPLAQAVDQAFRELAEQRPGETWWGGEGDPEFVPRDLMPAQAPQGLPPVDQREVGQVYVSPSGVQVRWNGVDWDLVN